MRLRDKRYGFRKFMYELEGLFLNSKWLENRFYFVWLGLEERKKERFRRQVRRILFKNVFGRSFKYAIARSVVQVKSVDGEDVVYVDVRSPLYRYLKSYVYKGNVREMVVDLENEVREYERVLYEMRMKNKREVKGYERRRV